MGPLLLSVLHRKLYPGPPFTSFTSPKMNEGPYFPLIYTPKRREESPFPLPSCHKHKPHTHFFLTFTPKRNADSISHRRPQNGTAHKMAPTPPTKWRPHFRLAHFRQCARALRSAPPPSAAQWFAPRMRTARVHPTGTYHCEGARGGAGGWGGGPLPGEWGRGGEGADFEVKLRGNGAPRWVRGESESKWRW